VALEEEENLHYSNIVYKIDYRDCEASHGQTKRLLKRETLE